MNTSDFNSQAKQHFSFYGGFVKSMLIGAAVLAATLLAMAYFLL